MQQVGFDEVFIFSIVDVKIYNFFIAQKNHSK